LKDALHALHYRCEHVGTLDVHRYDFGAEALERCRPSRVASATHAGANAVTVIDEVLDEAET